MKLVYFKPEKQKKIPTSKLLTEALALLVLNDVFPSMESARRNVKKNVEQHERLKKQK